MTDIVLIHPGNAKAVYQSLADDVSAIEPPIWCRMIAGWLNDNAVDVDIIDQEAERLSNEEVAERVKNTGAPIVALVAVGHQPSASTQQMPQVLALAKAMEGVKKIVVGHHVSALPVSTLKYHPEIDYVCDGEGPWTLLGLVRGFDMCDISGLVWRGPTCIVSNKRASLIPIDELHGDVWDMLPMSRYRAHIWQCLDGSKRQPYASIYTTLGCPFSCSFCMINVFQHANTYRRRAPEKVVEQIDMLYTKYGVKTFKFSDEMFVLDRKHYTAICEGLAAKPYANELNIWAYARIDTIKPEILPLLRRAGIRWLALGIESASSSVRDGSDKHFSNQDIKYQVNAVQKAGISVIGNFIFGLPNDTMETMQDTLELAKSLDLEFANFYCAMAYPGSELYRVSSPKDLPAEWSGYSQHSYDTMPLSTSDLSSKEVMQFRDDVYKVYFSDERYLSNVRKKFGVQAVDTITRMTSVNLPRRLLE